MIKRYFHVFGSLVYLGITVDVSIYIYIYISIYDERLVWGSLRLAPINIQIYAHVLEIFEDNIFALDPKIAKFAKILRVENISLCDDVHDQPTNPIYSRDCTSTGPHYSQLAKSKNGLFYDPALPFVGRISHSKRVSKQSGNWKLVPYNDDAG